VPTYDYQCRTCGTVTEVIHSMLADGPTTCERCGGELRRVLFPTGIIFKGSGFYRNDSRAAATPPAGTGSTSGDGASGSEKGPATDAKAPSTAKDGGGAASDGSGGKTATPASDS
jgi:putative FmdB family regulatory protein